jgi:hypothetical protein
MRGRAQGSESKESRILAAALIFATAISVTKWLAYEVSDLYGVIVDLAHSAHYHHLSQGDLDGSKPRQDVTVK